MILNIISQSVPSKEDVDSVIELTASKVVDDLKALSMTLYLVEEKEIVFKFVYFSPILWANNASLEQKFEDKKQKLLALRLPLETGLVGEVIATGESNFFCLDEDGPEKMLDLSKNTEFAVTSMLTVALKSDCRIIGAIQVLNKEPASDGSPRAFTRANLMCLEEVGGYTSALLLRMLDSNYKINEEDAARYISNYTDTPLVTDESDLSFDKTLLARVGADIIRTTNVLPYKLTSKNHVAVLMKNPLDITNREAFSLKTSLSIDEVWVASASLMDTLIKRYCH